MCDDMDPNTAYNLATDWDAPAIQTAGHVNQAANATNVGLAALVLRRQVDP